MTSKKNVHWYQAIAVIEYVGTFSRAGFSQGHYICDVKEADSSTWYRTKDEKISIKLDVSEVSKNAYVVLYKRANVE